MSLLGKIKEIFTADLALTDEKAWSPSLWNMAGSQSLSGENVTPASALTYSAVYNAIALISGTLGSLPLHLMQKKGKKKQLADEKPLYRGMHDEFNPYMTAMVGREVLAAHILSWGNGYAEIVRDGLGIVRQLWPIPPDRMTVELKDGDLLYSVRVDKEQITLPREKVLHIPGLGFDGYMGYSVISLARKSIGLGMAIETFGSLYFGQGTHPGVVVSHPNKLSATAASNLETSLVKEYSGLGKSHRLLLLEEGMKMETIGIPPDDSQFLESRQFQVTDVARWFNLPVHKLKEMTKSSFNNIQEEQQSFVTDSILPWLIRLEQNYNMQLLLPNEYGRQRLYFKHIVEGLLRGDSKSRGEFYAKMFGIGAFTINDIRELEDKDPVTHKFADEHFVPMNMVPLSMIEKMLEKEKESPSAPAPQRENGEDQDEAESPRRPER